MANRTYSDQERQRALEIYVEHGPAEAARQTGIRRATISMWANRAGVTVTRKEAQAAMIDAAQITFAERRAELRPKLLAAVHDLIARLYEPHQEFVGQSGKEVRYERPPAGAVRSYATSIGILIDKMRLELGEHTSSDRREDVSKLDREIDNLLAEFDRRDATHANGNGNGRVA